MYAPKQYNMNQLNSNLILYYHQISIIVGTKKKKYKNNYDLI